MTDVSQHVDRATFRQALQAAGGDVHKVSLWGAP
jgi:hypothetical protein